MLLKDKASIEKLNGRYFTPQIISDFVTKWVLNQNVNISNILEPSVGEGVFLKSINKVKKEIESNIFAIEIDEYTATQAATLNGYELISNCSMSNCSKESAQTKVVINDDFYNVYKNGLNNIKFQAILGNPPYIRYQYLTDIQRNEQSEILTKNLMKSNKLINSWVSFTVACVSCMDSSSRIGLVLPAELLQVKYSEALREFLLRQLNRCTIITFDELVFDNIEQEVVILLGEKISQDSKHLIKVVSCKNAGELNENILYEKNFMCADNISKKWSQYFLSDEQIRIINDIKNNNSFIQFSDVAKCEVGITTGNNKYFCINNEIVQKFDLEQYCSPLIARSVNIRGVQFLKEDWEENVSRGARTYLLDLSAHEKKEFSKGLLDYIKWGEDNDHNISYKTKIRDEWYNVPSVWSPDLFFLRRNYRFPKIVLNSEQINAVSTDTMHRVKLKNSTHGKRLILAYYTSIGFLFSELEGRSYGGGVLEILPSEVSTILLPNIFENHIISEEETEEYFQKIDMFIRENDSDNIEVLLNELDEMILINKIGLSHSVVLEIRNAWRKLQNRRLYRGKSI